jgi:hypothetical protein
VQRLGWGGFWRGLVIDGCRGGQGGRWTDGEAAVRRQWRRLGCERGEAIGEEEGFNGAGVAHSSYYITGRAIGGPFAD